MTSILRRPTGLLNPTHTEHDLCEGAAEAMADVVAELQQGEATANERVATPLPKPPPWAPNRPCPLAQVALAKAMQVDANLIAHRLKNVKTTRTESPLEGHVRYTFEAATPWRPTLRHEPNIEVRDGRIQRKDGICYRWQQHASGQGPPCEHGDTCLLLHERPDQLRKKVRFNPREQVICVPPAPRQKEATANEREADFHDDERVADIQRAIRKVKAKAANRAKPAGAPSGKASSSKREWPRGSVLPEKRSPVASIPWFETEPDVEEQDKKRLRQEREMIEMRGEVPWYMAKECVRDFWSCGYCHKVNMASSRLCRFGECRKPRPEELALNNLRHEGPQMLKAWIQDNPSLQPGSTQLSQ